MRHLTALLALTTLTAATAQSATPTGALTQAARQVIAYLPDLQNAPLALALKRSAAKSVRVYVIAPRNAHLIRGSFLPSVALANAETPPLPLSYHFRTLNTQPYLIVDNRIGFIGSGLITGGPNVRAMTASEVTTLVKFSTDNIKASHPIPARVLIKERYGMEY